MDPLRKMMGKFSQGRRSSVDPMRIRMDESCLTNTVSKKSRSGIPILSGVSKKRRSSSCDRSHTGVSSNWSSVMSSERSNSAGLLFTPQKALQTPKMSLTARAAVDCISQLSCKSHTAKKDNRSISDKNVQMRLARHVSLYLNKTGLVGDILKGGQGTAPSEAIQPAALRNMNKNAFLNLFNLLYKELGARGKIDVHSNDYQERIPAIAKKLGYPGIINKSHLLTPSSPHAWPYIIGFLAWIVDLVESVALYENIVMDETNIPLAYLRFHLVAYNAYNKMEITGAPPPEYLEKFKENLMAIRNVEHHVMDKIREEYNIYNTQYEAELSNLEKMVEKQQKIDNEIEAMTMQVERLSKDAQELSDKIALVSDERSRCKEDKNLLVEKNEELRKEKEMLAIACSQQKMSKEEWDVLRGETKELEISIKTTVEAIDNIKITIDKTDLQISAKRNKLSKLWMTFMNDTAPMQPDIPSVKLFLDELLNFRPMHQDALQVFKQIEDALLHAHSEIVAKVSHNQAKARNLQDQEYQLKSVKFKEIIKEHECLRMQCKEKEKAIESLRKSLMKEEEKLNKNVEDLEQEIKRLQRVITNDDIDEMNKLKEKEKMKKEEFSAIQKKAVFYFEYKKELHDSYEKELNEKLKSFYAEAETLLKVLGK